MRVPNLQVRDLPQELHVELRRRARQQRVSVTAYVIELIRRELSRPSTDDWRGRLRSRKPVELDEPPADLIAEARAARDAGRR